MMLIHHIVFRSPLQLEMAILLFLDKARRIDIARWRAPSSGQSHGSATIPMGMDVRNNSSLRPGLALRLSMMVMQISISLA